MKPYTWDELQGHSVKELENIREILQNSLYEKKREKNLIVSNILQLQELIGTE